MLGFDWHSSGVTTTVCGAVKEAIKDVDRDLGFFAAGGKGRTSRKTPSEVALVCEKLGRDPVPLVYASRAAAKVDSAAVQDGYQLYHHAFFFTTAGEWTVVQQGMSDETRMARRYHWLSDTVASFVDEPHEAVCCDARAETLNLVAHENEAIRRASTELASQPPHVTLDVLASASLPELTMPVRQSSIRQSIGLRLIVPKRLQPSNGSPPTPRILRREPPAQPPAPSLQSSLRRASAARRR